MRVYDIVMIAHPDHQGSYPPGRWFVDHRFDQSAAKHYTEQCNQCRMVFTLHYEVEEHDDLDLNRAPIYKSV